MKTQARGDAKRKAILAYVREQFVTMSYSPTIRDIAEKVGASPATVHRHVRILADQGLLVYRPGRSRTIRPVQPLREDPS